MAIGAAAPHSNREAPAQREDRPAARVESPEGRNMRSIVSSTTHFNDADRMLRDLIIDIPDLPPAESVGFLACASQSNHDALAGALQKALPFPVVGGTTLRSPFAPREEDVGASLTVLSRPGLRYAIGVSGEPKAGGERELMEKLHRDCTVSLGAAPALFLLIMPILPNLMAGDYLKHLFSLAGRVPVFGGMVSDDFDSDRFAVFAGGRAYQDRMVMVGIGGSVDPVFSVGCRMTALSGYRPTVTEADGNIIRRVDTMTFCEFLTRMGFPEDVRLLSDFTLCVSIEGGVSARDGIPEITHLARTDPESGSGFFGSDIPEGSRISLGVLRPEDVVGSAAHCIGEMAAAMRAREAAGYEFGMAFCLPCVGRYYAMLGRDNEEGRMLREAFSAVPLFGYYGFNEICPSHDTDGRRFNRQYSDSMVICAL